MCPFHPPTALGHGGHRWRSDGGHRWRSDAGHRWLSGGGHRWRSEASFWVNRETTGRLWHIPFFLPETIHGDPLSTWTCMHSRPSSNASRTLSLGVNQDDGARARAVVGKLSSNAIYISDVSIRVLQAAHLPAPSHSGPERLPTDTVTSSSQNLRPQCKIPSQQDSNLNAVPYLCQTSNVKQGPCFLNLKPKAPKRVPDLQRKPSPSDR